MAAANKVLRSLELDRQRSLRRTATARTNEDEFLILDSDSDNEENGENKEPKTKQAPGRRLSMRDAGLKLINVQRITMTGVRLTHVSQYVSSLDRGQTEAQMEFTGKILSSAPLMAKSTEIIRQLYEPLFIQNPQSPSMKSISSDGGYVLSLVTKIIHKIKVATAQTCWAVHVKSLLAKADKLEAQNEEWKNKLHDIRTAYLEEVVALRDEVRARPNPDDGLPNMDVFFIADPQDFCEPKERKFLLQAVTEKLKMILEHNPTVEKVIDLGQLERLKNMVESHEVQEMRAAIQRVMDQLDLAKKEVQELKAEKKNASRSMTTTPTAGAEANIMQCLEDQVQDLQAKLSDERAAAKTAQKRCGGLEMERDDLANALREEIATKMLLKEQIAQLQERLDAEKVQSQTVGHEAENLRASASKHDDQITGLKKKLERSKAAKSASGAEPIMGGLCEACSAPLDANIQFGIKQVAKSTKPLPPQPAASGGLSLDGAKLAGADAGAGNASPRPSPAPKLQPVAVASEIEELHKQVDEAEAHTLEVMHERDIAIEHGNKLDVRCGQLRDMFTAHAQKFMLLQSEAVLDDAENLSQKGYDLGCTSIDSIADEETAELARICQCGNILMKDAAFCRKCGSPWDEQKFRDRSLTQETLTVLTLAAKLQDAEDGLQKAVKDLKQQIAPSNLADGATLEVVTEEPTSPASGSKSPRSPSRKSRSPSPISPASPTKGSVTKMQRIMDAETALAKAKREKENLESRLLVARVRELQQAPESKGDSNVCTCHCKEELEALRKLLVRTQGLCNETAYKLKNTAEENVRISKALARVQGTLKDASKNVGDGGGEGGKHLRLCMDAIVEAQHHTVFDRLTSTDTPTKAKWESRRLKLMQEMTTTVYQIDTNALHTQIQASCRGGDAIQRVSRQPSGDRELSNSSSRHHTAVAEVDQPFLVVQSLEPSSTENAHAEAEVFFFGGTSSMGITPTMSSLATRSTPLSRRNSDRATTEVHAHVPPRATPPRAASFSQHSMSPMSATGSTPNSRVPHRAGVSRISMDSHSLPALTSARSGSPPAAAAESGLSIGPSDVLSAGRHEPSPGHLPKAVPRGSSGHVRKGFTSH